MKQLILTFFAAILCYSLFFDKEPKTHAIDEIDYIRQDAALVPNPKAVPDTMTHFALYSLETEGLYYIPQYGEVNFAK
jgi:hypothetical protein